ncbi:thiamine pyrophosphokinase-related protein-like protein [Xylogone sp. PMI_703]|nr:thiamine pyrophosphokinase-related protein-like protein [Xylogone sp. PMI_703]
MKSNLDLMNECDNFPYEEKDPKAYSELMSTLYTLVWQDGDTEVPIGYILESVLTSFIKVPVSIKGEIEVNRAKRTVSAFPQSSEEERSKAVAATCDYWRKNKTFSVLSGWRDELYPVYGPKNEIIFSIERSAASLFGVVTYGVHMTAYVKSPESKYGMKLWIPRRAATKQTYGGMLDNTVAGGIATGEDRSVCLVREAHEEASLPEDLVRDKSVYIGPVTYSYTRGAKAGGETGLIQPECEHIYDLELPEDVVPSINDTEVDEFYLWTVEEVQKHLAKGEFKPNCAIVILDFFIRHGVLTPENEPNFEEIKRRLHRDLVFPGPYKTSV